MLKNKRGIIFGIANDHSIAWGIAKNFIKNGAQIAVTYQNDVLLKRVQPLAKSINVDQIIECDVSEKESVKNCFKKLQSKWSSIDFVVHAIAYSDKNELAGRYIDTTSDNFLNSLNISCYSFTSILKEASKLMENGGSAITLTFHGSTKVMPNYNVMGIAKAALETSVKYLSVDLGLNNIRVNAISAGPMRTLSGAAISDARKVFQHTKKYSPLGRNVDLEELGNTALYLVSDLSSGVTGEILYVDCGYNIIGMPNI
tara:strand:+ start:1686 stop:2456 length:771 start_codon:yes stop_codon:yes gene_type:complete